MEKMVNDMAKKYFEYRGVSHAVYAEVTKDIFLNQLPLFWIHFIRLVINLPDIGICIGEQ